VLGGRSEPGSDQQGAELVAVQAGGVRLVVQAGAADMGGRGVVQQFLLDGVSRPAVAVNVSPVAARAVIVPGSGNGEPGARPPTRTNLLGTVWC
jgi:hypothetical protein